MPNAPTAKSMTRRTPESVVRLFVVLALALLAACTQGPPQPAPAPVHFGAHGQPATQVVVSQAVGDALTLGGTCTSSAAPILQVWAQSTGYSSGQVRRTTGGLVVKYTGSGTSASSGSGPTAAGTGTDGTAPYVAYLGTTATILFSNADASSAVYVGLGSQITATGDLSGALVPAGVGIVMPPGTDVTRLDCISGGSVLFTVMLTFP